MRMEKLKESDTEEFCKFARKIINETPYYDRDVKKWEMEPFMASSVNGSLKKQDILCLLAKDKNKIIGFAYGNFSGKSGTFYAVWLGVKKEYRRKGIATRLMGTMLGSLRDKNIHKIWGDTTVDNKESIGILRKLGFRRIVKLRKHWFKHDYYLWEKFL